MQKAHLFHSSLLLLLSLPATLAVSTIIATVTAAPAPASTSYTNDTIFHSQILLAHNFYRTEHGVKNLTWNDTSARTAQKYSAGCVWKHSGGPTGENLAQGYGNVTASVDAWGSERSHYDFKKPTGFSEATGHFTQLVWSNTTTVGCGRTNCAGKNNVAGYYVVCEYYPAGNIVGNNNRYFIDNVPRQVEGKLSDTVESGIRAAGSRSIRYCNDLWGLGVIASAFVVSLGFLV